MSFTKKGSCLFGEIAYQVNDAPLFTHACHCTTCQKITGTSYWLSMSVLEKDFEILTGKPEIVYPPQQHGIAAKHYCANCACNVYGTHTYLENLVLPATGTFEDTNWLELKRIIFVRGKQPWIQIPKNVPAFEERYERAKVWPQ